MRPPFSYYGGKVGMSAKIVELLPPHRVYIEPFAGSLAVLFAKPPSAHEIVNDLDSAVVTFFRVLREQPEALAEVCRLTPHARDEFSAADPYADGLEDLEVARRFWVRVNQSFAKTAGQATGWSLTVSRDASVASSIANRIDRFAACARRLSTVAIEHCDAAGLVERMAKTDDTVIYADPPYLGSTRNSRTLSRSEDYRHDMGDEDAHRRLAEVLHATHATVVLSGYPSPLYDELYDGWWRHEVPVTVHSSNALRNDRGTRVEVLWSNRDLGRQLRLEGIA